MTSRAKTVAQYLAEAPPERRAALRKLRTLIRSAAPRARESIEHGMPYYTLDGRPLFALASQKNTMSLYVCEVEAIASRRARLGRVDCGQSCIRFRRLEDLSLPVVKEILADARRRSARRQPDARA